jgi:hypothetical protein
MTTKTRYFVIVSLLVMGVGLGTGLVAYYVGLPMGAFQRNGGPDELQYIPRDATVIAFANVQEVMNSELRRKLRRVVPMPENGQREFENETGINIETDIDRVVAALNPDPGGTKVPGAGMVLARGRFSETKIEALMRDHGAHVEDYKTKRLIVGDLPDAVKPVSSSGLSVAFLEPGLVAVGSTTLIRRAIDLHQTGDNPQAGLQSVTGNEELMTLVRSLDMSGNAWAVGRFDALTSQAHLPEKVAGQLPSITWFSVSGRVNGGIHGIIRAEARDDEAANNLRDVVRGFLALAKMQAGARPEFQLMMQSLELGGTGKTVALSFAVPAAVFDMVPGLQKDLPAPKPPVH